MMELEELAKKLNEVPDNCDLWVGIISEFRRSCVGRVRFDDCGTTI